MEWEVLLHREFILWLEMQPEDFQDYVLAYQQLLNEMGPYLGRPRVDTVYGSRFPNMKELRIQHKGNPWRVLFAFDPKCRSILLVGGNKQGDKRWYERNIPLADSRLEQNLKEMEKDHGNTHG